MFKRVLVANRGEIACRIIRSCRRLGIETVAVYSDADSNAMHVREADIALHIGAAPPSDSYLCVERILDAATGSESQAIHPGYGFLSENAAFAGAVADAGLVFIGPQAETISRMGSKSEARRIMAAAGVPVVPGYHGDEQSPKALATEAGRIGFPLLIKAAAGGGGKGMRVVHSIAEFSEALASACREARNAFGDDKMILERFVASPRHIEVQVFGDRHGNHVHLFERDCSAQRRYQKILEFAPALDVDPGSGAIIPFDENVRNGITTAALDAARAVDYVGAGTVEFLLGDGWQFWFMEMNTRLQVEHPVTEMVTGVDLVEWQLRVAAGEALPLAQEDIRLNGHAMEARIYAEDPRTGFLPSSGLLERIVWPGQGAGDPGEPESGIRIDTGVHTGDRITVHYDPMIAKLIVHADNPASMIDRMQRALAHTAIFGPITNITFLQHLLDRTRDRCGSVDTTYVDRHVDAFAAESRMETQALLPAVLRVLRGQERHAAAQAQRSGDPHSAWSRLDAWRVQGAAQRTVLLSGGATQWRFDANSLEDGFRVHHADVTWSVVESAAGTVVVDGRETDSRVYRCGDRIQLVTRGDRVELTVLDPHASDVPDEAETFDLLAPMPGKVIAIRVTEGDEVSEGQPLVIMEAMKMELTIRAPRHAVVASLPHREGEFVEADTLLVHFEEEPAIEESK